MQPYEAMTVVVNMTGNAPTGFCISLSLARKVISFRVFAEAWKQDGVPDYQRMNSCRSFSFLSGTPVKFTSTRTNYQRLFFRSGFFPQFHSSGCEIEDGNHQSKGPCFAGPERQTSSNSSAVGIDKYWIEFWCDSQNFHFSRSGSTSAWNETDAKDKDWDWSR